MADQILGNVDTAVQMQGKAKLTLIVDSTEDWKRFVPTTIDLTHGGLGVLEIEEGLRVMAEINGISFEATLAGYLAWKKALELSELEVETTARPEWGKMVWIPDHPTYLEPPKDDFEALFRMSFYRATFKTENAGVQRFCLYSTAINGRFHKTLVFHKIVLKSIEARQVQAVAATSSPA